MPDELTSWHAHRIEEILSICRLASQFLRVSAFPSLLYNSSYLHYHLLSLRLSSLSSSEPPPPFQHQITRATLATTSQHQRPPPTYDLHTTISPSLHPTSPLVSRRHQPTIPRERVRTLTTRSNSLPSANQPASQPACQAGCLAQRPGRRLPGAYSEGRAVSLLPRGSPHILYIIFLLRLSVSFLSSPSPRNRQSPPTSLNYPPPHHHRTTSPIHSIPFRPTPPPIHAPNTTRRRPRAGSTAGPPATPPQLIHGGRETPDT